MKANKTFLNYNEVLERIERGENHLLLANGFNYGLGVHTGYKDIFNKMIENNHGIYGEAEKMIEECHYDLEAFLAKVSSHISEEDAFLRKYTCNKIKFDFMQALHEIVKSSIKNVYEEKNEGIFVLLQKFTNYFTLNYDSFLYLLLLKFKPIDTTENNSVAFLPTLEYIENDLNKRQEDIYSKIRQARADGTLQIGIGTESPTKRNLSLLPKGEFLSAIKTYSKAKNMGWTDKDISKVIKLILEEEKKNKVLSRVDDGSKQISLDFIFDEDSETQNLFFLHGAFHIIQDGKSTKKITQETNKALYNKLEEILNSDGKGIVCVFQSENKIDTIKNNRYLSHCYEKLSSLSGNIVIIGSSLADNDNHIFGQINNSKISNVFISSLPKEFEKNMNMAMQKFSNKNVYLFDADTISYEMPSRTEPPDEQ